MVEADRLAGSGGGNRLMGGYYSPAKGQLSIKQGDTTIMARPEALMHQERKLLDLLPHINAYSIDPTGALVLRTADGRQVLARR